MSSLTFPLHRAALTGNVAELQSLLQQSQQLQLINSKDNYCFTPLLHATNSGNLEALVMLLEKGAKTDICDYRGRAALHYAVEKGRFDMLLVLLDRGANIEQTDKNNRTALQLTSSTEIVQALIKNKSKMTKSSSNQEIEDGAADNQNEPANIETETNSLMNPIKSSKEEVSSNELETNGFHDAVIEGNLEKVQAFLQNGVNVDMKNEIGNTAVHLAAIGGFADIIKELLKYDATVWVTNNLGESALELAAKHGKEDCVEVLLTGEYLPENQSTNNKKSAIHKAIKLAGVNGHLNTVQLLWNKPEYVSKFKTAGLNDLEGIFHWAIDSKYLKFVSTITSMNNFNINVRHNNQTALHKVVRSNNLEILQWLLANPKIDINATDGSGSTPLYFAVWDSNKVVAQVLLDKGAMVTIDIFHPSINTPNRKDIMELVGKYHKPS